MRGAFGVKLAVSCALLQPAPVAADFAPEHRTAPSAPSEPRAVAQAYLEATQVLEARRLTLAAAHQADGLAAPGEAAELWHQALASQLLPRWVGTPWGGGATSNARVPREPGRTVHCGSFVMAVLQGAGLRFLHPELLAQAPALRMLEAVAPDDIVRLRGDAATMERRLLALGPGVYLLGLSRHIGFAVVTEDAVQLIHASEREGQVVSERAATSKTLRSRSATVFVAQLTASAASATEHKADRADSDDRADARLLRQGSAALLGRWLRGAMLGPR